MDFQIPLIFLAIFVIASAVLFFVYKFGIKEKSYEEALAEQRQQQHALLGGKVKASKEKKNKKATKKHGKEKPAETTEDQVDAPQPQQQQQQQNGKKPHVEFKEVVEEVPDVIEVQPITANKKTRKIKVQPILVNKDSVKEAVIDPMTPVEVNHFEELHPKDDFELLRSNSSDELVKQGGSKAAKMTKQAEVDVTKNNKQNHQPKIASAPVVKEKEEKNVEPPGGPSAANGYVTNVGKEKKKKKSEFNTLQQLQLSGDKNGLGGQAVLNLVRKAELSRNEVQILIDLLLNKQHEAPAVMDDWSEGKFDPVQKLKKQLSEREKQLVDEQQAVAGAQAKLREVRAEQLAERSQLQQKIRGYEEVLQNSKAEAARFHQQYQQLQAQLKEELLKEQKLREELANFQVLRQQLEMRLAQSQETEVIIPQLQNEVQELSTLNQQLRMELARLSEENAAEKERQQAFVVQMGGLHKELELQKTECARQVEESRLEVDRELEIALRQENDLKLEINRLKSAIQQQSEELRRLEHGKKQVQDEVFHLQKQKEESDKIISQYKSEMKKLEEQTQVQTNGSVEENKAHEVQLLNLQNELASVKNQLERSEQQYETELSASKSSIDQLQTELKAQKAKNNQVKNDQESQRQFVQRLFPEIKELKSISTDVFQEESQKYIREFVEDLQERSRQDQDTEDVDKLNSQLRHYKGVIDSTEKMLNNLQKHIEQEEINWRVQLAEKTAELEAIKQSSSPQVIERLASLEKQLKEEHEEKKKLLLECEQLRNESSSINKQILEDNNHWSEQHDGVNSTNGPALIDKSSK